MKTPSKDRRKLTRRIRDAWPTIRPMFEAGYPLKDIWTDWDEFKVSYRHFVRTILKIRREQAEKRPSTIFPGRNELEAREAVVPEIVLADGTTLDPLQNLKEHEARQKKHEYPGTRPAEELI
jgi:hypothetical protein